MKITEKEINVQTGEETITERELTKDELAAIKQVEDAAAARKAEAQANATAKAALLAQLGITEEQAKLLLS
jgi:hypothetical protein